MLHIAINKHYKKIILIAAVILFAVSSIAAFVNQSVTAESTDELRARARALEAEIQQANTSANSLANEADGLKRKIGELDAEISSVSAQIQLTGVRLQELDAKLQAAQKELERQKELLRASIVALYKKGGASGVELIVGSDSFTAYFNEQTYLERLKAGVQESTEKVIEIKQQIQVQREEQKQLLAQQEAQKNQLANTRTERERILADTQGRESAYREQSERMAAEQRKLFDEIIRRSRVLTSTGSGGYPWSSAICLSSNSATGSCRRDPIYEWKLPNGDAGWGLSAGAVRDPWGYYLRNCTSYVAWKINAVTGKDVPRLGHGGAWYYNAPGYMKGQTPKKGAAVSFDWGGSFGHVAYVEDVLDGGSKIRISEYNFVQDGVYSERIVSSTSSIAGYVYFE